MGKSFMVESKQAYSQLNFAVDENMVAPTQNA